MIKFDLQEFKVRTFTKSTHLISHVVCLIKKQLFGFSDILINFYEVIPHFLQIRGTFPNLISALTHKAKAYFRSSKIEGCIIHSNLFGIIEFKWFRFGDVYGVYELHNDGDVGLRWFVIFVTFFN